MNQFKISKFTLTVLVILSLVILSCACSPGTPVNGSKSEYFPDKSFRESSPEAQGMDSEKLSRMLAFIRDGGYEIHSIKVIRNGYKVLDTSFFPYSDNNLHAVNSVTKSVTSSLVGIALEEKKIKSIDDKMLDFFPERKPKNPGEYKSSMTLKNLLMMTGGFDWNENGSYGPDDSWMKMANDADPIGYILDQPVTTKPGEKFYYNTGISHVLSAILQKSTGQKAADYAQEKLFSQLGIEQPYWDQDKTGISIGGAALYLKPEDMAKFGYLYLRNGKWNGKQLIPEAWVRESTSRQIDTPDGLAGKYGYGYQWWMNDFGGYSARGFGGQYIFVLPEYDLVIAITSGLRNNEFFIPEGLAKDFIIGSISEKGTLQDNKAAYDNLLALEKELARAPKPSLPARASAIAKEVSGKIYVLDDKAEISFIFDKEDECTFCYTWEGMTDKLTVGLDGVWRITDNNRYGSMSSGNSNAAKGDWINEKQFVFSVKSLNDIGGLDYTINFDDTGITVETSDMWGSGTERGRLK